MKRGKRIGVIAALAAVALWCLAVWGMGLATRAAYEDGDFSAAAARAKVASGLNPLQRHTALFNRGTAWAAQGNLGPARLELERALVVTPEDGACRVRINLAAVVESQGDSRAGDPALAGRFFRHAEAVLAGAPESCRPAGSAMAQRYRAARERLEGKTEPPPSQSDGGGEEESPEDSKSDAVKKRSEDAAARQEGSDRQRGDQDKALQDGGGAGPEKPW